MDRLGPRHLVPAWLAFALRTFANLAVRAAGHRRGHRQHFTDYPAERRALIPFL